MKKNPIAEIVTADKRDEQLKNEEAELLEKLRESNKANSEYSEELEAIKERELKAAEQEANPFAAFTQIQTDIEKTNQEYLDSQKDLADSIDNTIKAVEEEKTEESSESAPEEGNAEPVENKEEPKKKSSLQGLLDSAKKLKK